MELVAFVGSDKENWGQVTALINRMDCEKVFLVKDKNVTTFPTTSKCEIVSVNTKAPLMELKNDLTEKLRKALSKEFEVALSLASGNGKEHMALISSLLSVPVGIRLVVYTKEGIQFAN